MPFLALSHSHIAVAKPEYVSKWVWACIHSDFIVKEQKNVHGKHRSVCAR